MKRLWWWIVGLMVIAQLSIPAYLIIRQEDTLKHGRLYKFKTAPVDPYDAFRGKYVQLSFDAGRVPLGSVVRDYEAGYSGRAYATLGEDAEGYAFVKKLSYEPAKLDQAIPVHFYESWVSKDKTNIVITFPFERYYMEEGKAPEAEKVYREHSRGGKRDAVALVRVKNSYAALEDVLIDGEPIRKIVKRKLQAK